MSANEGQRLLLIGTGALGVSLLPGWVLYLRHHLGLDLRVALSGAAEGLVSTNALSVLSGHPTLTAQTTRYRDGIVSHREWADWPDLVIVAPATGNTLAKAAAGIADTLTSTLLNFTLAPTLFVPSLTSAVASRPAIRRAIDSLRADGAYVMEPREGVSAHTGAPDPAAMPTVLDVQRYVAQVGLGHWTQGGPGAQVVEQP